MNSRQRISDFQQHVNSQVAAIRQAGGDAWKSINLTQTEPQIVYDFLRSTRGGTGHLNRALGRLLSTGGRTLKFASIFLHQKPMVRGLIGKTPVGGKCELGDLQILFLYISANKSLIQCRSTIFQAKKKTSTGPHVINHPDQRRLYDKCLGFVYRSVLKSEMRCFPLGLADRERALQYLFVGNLPVRARLIPSDVNHGAFIDFGEIILRFLNDSTGYGVTTKPSRGKNWSRIVWDQIDNVAKTAFGRQGDRNSALKSILNHFNSFDEPKEFFLEVPPSDKPESSGGIPMLLIIVSDAELGPEKIPLLQTHNEITGERKSERSLLTPPVSVSEKESSTTSRYEKGSDPGRKKELGYSNLDDLLAELDSSTPQKQHEIVLELEHRTRWRTPPDQELRKILDVLNNICHSLPPKTVSIAFRLQQTLKSKATTTQNLFIRQ